VLDVKSSSSHVLVKHDEGQELVGGGIMLFFR
jgi:hypothetical protein